MSETKNNHYVPQFYTSAWLFNDKQVYCLNKKTGKIFTPSPKNICADRIWEQKIETAFTDRENHLWRPVLDKILEKESLNDLSIDDLKAIISFGIAMQTRKKPKVEVLFQAVKSNLAKQEQDWIKNKIVSLEEANEMKNYDKAIIDNSFSTVFDLNKLFNDEGESWKFTQLLKLNMGLKKISDSTLGEFTTSDSPLSFIMSSKFEDIVELMIMPLTPSLLLYGVRGVNQLKAIYNKPIEMVISLCNKQVFDRSEYIIAKGKRTLEGLLNNHTNIITT